MPVLGLGMAHLSPPQTVLLLHAYPLSSAMWDSQRQSLELAGLRVLAPDLPGFGTRADEEMSSLADVAAEIIATLPPEPVSVVGLSMGGYITLELLAQAPQRFGRVVLADTSARSDAPDKQQDREAQAQRVLTEGKQFLIDAAYQEHPEATYQAVKPTIEAAGTTGIAAALRAMAGRPDHLDTLKALSIPLLVLAGEKDDITPEEVTRELAELGHGEYHVIPNAAHLSNLDNPEEFNAALLDFLA